MERHSCVVAVVAESVWPMELVWVLERAYAKLDAVYLRLVRRNSIQRNTTTAMVLTVDVDSATNCVPSNSNDYQTYDVE